MAVWVPACLFVFLNLPGLSLYPPAHDDEAWFACSAYSLASTGRMACGLFAGSEIMKGLDEHTYWQPPLYFAILAPLLRTFGPSLLVARLLSLAAGGLLLAALGSLGRRVFKDGRVAVLAVLLAGLDPFFLVAARTGRMDMVCALFGFLLMAALVRVADTPSSRLCLGAGVLAACAALTHPVGAVPAVAAWIVCLALAWQGLLKLRPVVLFSLPQALGLALWALYVLQAPAQFHAQFGRNCLRSHGTGLSLTTLRYEALERYWKNYGPERLPLLALFLGAACWLILSRLLLRRGSASERIPALFLALYLAAFALASGSKSEYHFAHTVPYLALASAALLMSLLAPAGRPAPWRRRFALAALALCLLVELGHVGRMGLLVFRHRAGMDYGAFTTSLLREIPGGKTVLGSAALWYAFEGSGRKLLDDPLLDPLEGRAAAIDYVVVLPSYFPRNDLFADLWARRGERLNDRPARLREWLLNEADLVDQIGTSDMPLAWSAALFRIRRGPGDAGAAAP